MNAQSQPDSGDAILEAFERYRAEKFGAYAEYPIDAFTHFGAGFEAARIPDVAVAAREPITDGIEFELCACRHAVATIEANRSGSETQNHNFTFYQGKVAGLEFALAAHPSEAIGRPHPEVVAAVQEAIMRHPFWKPGLGSSGFAFGLANTAIDAYLSALSRPHREATVSSPADSAPSQRLPE